MASSFPALLTQAASDSSHDSQLRFYVLRLPGQFEGPLQVGQDFGSLDAQRPIHVT